MSNKKNFPIIVLMFVLLIWILFVSFGIALAEEQLKTYESQKFNLKFEFPHHWIIEEREFQQESPSKDVANFQVFLKDLEYNEVVVMTIFSKSEELTEWLLKNKSADIKNGLLDFSKAKCTISSKEAYMWLTSELGELSGVSIVFQGDNYLYEIGFSLYVVNLENINSLIKSITIGSGGSTNLSINIQELGYGIQLVQDCCNETDMGTNTYPCGSKPNTGNCTWKCEEQRSGSNNFIFGGPGTGRDAYRWMSLAHQYTSYAQGGNIPTIGAILVAIDDYGGFGHVATVTGINSDGSINVIEQNYDLTCTRNYKYDTSWLRSYIAGYIYTGSSFPDPSAKNVGTSETIVDDFNFNNTYNFIAKGPGSYMSFNGNERAWGTYSVGSHNNWMHYVKTISGSSKNSGSWKVNIQTTGYYEIKAYIPNNSYATASAAKYKVDGTWSNAIDQNSSHGQWVTIYNPGHSSGWWNLNAGSKYIELFDNNSGQSDKYLAFDAIKLIYKGATSGYAAVSSGVTVTPSTIYPGNNFNVTFTLHEINGSSITYSEITCAILDANDNFLFDLAKYTNVTVPANGYWTYPNATGYLNNAGTYKAVARGKVNNWFDFTTTGSGVNPRTFQVTASGYASVSSGVTVTPSTIYPGNNFNVTFTLHETNGAPITYSEITCSILDANSNHLFDLTKHTNVTVAANGYWTYPSATGYLNNAGTYKAVARGKVTNWFDFTTTGSGVNPRIFQVTGKYPSGNIPLTANPSSIPNNGGTSTITSGTIKYNDGTTVSDGTLIEVETNLGTVSPIGNNVLFSDDMENGQNGWTATGFWHLVQQGVSPYPEAHSPTHSWWYGQDAKGNYDNGQTNSGTLISPAINLTSAATLSFWRWEETESGSSWDTRKVYISTNNGSSWTQIYQSTGQNQKTWVKESINLSSYAGNTIKLKFEFNTVDHLYNNYRGWYIDDVKVETGTSSLFLAYVDSVSNKNNQEKNALGTNQLNDQRQDRAEQLSAVDLAVINQNVTLTGLQIPTSGGIIQFKLTSGSATGTANVTAQSVEGDAQGQVNVTITGSNNLALNRPVTVSSTYSSSYPGSNAVDGNSSTYWRSENGTSSDHFEWIYVNLGSQYNVNKVILNWYSSYYATYFTIQTWNGSQWIIQTTITNGSGGIETIQLSAPILTQYVAIGCEQPYSNTYSYAIGEFEIYSSGTSLLNTTFPLVFKEPSQPVIQTNKVASNAKVNVQNFPNPFNPSTRICFSLPKASFVILKIYNLVGQELETLLNEHCQAGEYEIQWNAKELPSGIYLYHLEFEAFSETNKLILMK